MGAVEVRRRAAWHFVRAIVRSQAGGVVGAVLSGLLWQTGAIAAPLIVSYTIDHGIVPRDRHTLGVWLLALLGVGLVAGGGGRPPPPRSTPESCHAPATRSWSGCWRCSESGCSRWSGAACATSTRSATAQQPTRGFATRSSRTRSGSTPPTTTASARAS